MPTYTLSNWTASGGETLTTSGGATLQFRQIATDFDYKVLHAQLIDRDLTAPAIESGPASTTFAFQDNWVDDSGNQMVDESGNHLVFYQQTTGAYPRELTAPLIDRDLTAPEIDV